MIRGAGPVITELNERSREIFRHIVEAYVHTGEPIGSRTLSRRLPVALSPATIRNVMADLEDLGLLYAPHTSAGRLPTQAGMRMFVNGLLEIGGLPEDERSAIDAQCRAAGKSIEQVLGEAIGTLSGLSRCAGVVAAPKTQRSLKHIEFVWLGHGRCLVVLVTEGGLVENRILDLPDGVEPSALVEATNYLNHRLAGRSLDEVREEVLGELELQRHQLDELTQRVIEAGLATWSGDGARSALIVRGQSHLLDDITAVEDLERIRGLFEALETSERFLRLLDLTGTAEGVQIFIGSENELFGVTGCSMIVAPYHDARERIIGAIGVIGPQRLNFARIIPMVDYTAKVVGRLIG
ncbi:heat-inducible transcriptional repressor HrcA [Magnetospirillum sp. UT-4]|uniref:heat-inducible transcriptional repressor HrcA n=1 Tax=Magnetospirillum sp. UT-4 TaxID=2681467 RepID=UPI00137CEC86|nr:heat-inducible transcriptional repressor HrcA [Magnetospirillum sp. UT-4]CAA7617305.1 Heat-inducible transcription repressor HrcA [Magnetospirillum sp. UT-4]